MPHRPASPAVCCVNMPPKSPTQRLYDTLLREHVRLLLKPEGFAHAGASFRRRWSDGWHVVNFQKSQWGDRHSVHFTINIGVACDAWTRFERGDPATPPSEGACPFRVRVGDFLPGDRDQWWTLDEDTNFERLTTEVVEVLRESVLPFLGKMASTKALIASLKRRSRPPRGWGLVYYPLVLATLVRHDKSQLEKLIKQMQLRAGKSNNDADPAWIAAKVRRLREKW